MAIETRQKQPVSKGPIIGISDIRCVLRTVSTLTSNAAKLNRAAATLINTNPTVADVKKRLDNMMNDLALRCNEAPAHNDPWIQSTLQINGSHGKGLGFEIVQWRQSLFVDKLYVRKCAASLKKFGFVKAETQRDDCVMVLKDTVTGVRLFLTAEPTS